MVEETVHDWSHHICENILSDEVHGVLNDYDTKVDELVHDEGGNGVIVVQV